jgi:hypothetical protein
MSNYEWVRKTRDRWPRTDIPEFRLQETSPGPNATNAPIKNMGGGSSKLVKYKVLLLGLDGAGKTTLLYKLRLKNAQAEFFGK